MKNADPYGTLAQAEAEIAARQKSRDGMQPEFRSAIALETIADELVRWNAEAKTLRYLFATYASRYQK